MESFLKQTSLPIDQGNHSQLVIWQKKYQSVFPEIAGSVIQKITASDDGFLYLSLYKPGKRLQIVLSLRQKDSGLEIVEKKQGTTASKPNAFVQIARKHIHGRKISHAYFGINPYAIFLKLDPSLGQVDENAPNENTTSSRRDKTKYQEPDVNFLILDLEAKPPRLCLCISHDHVPERYSDQFRGETSSTPCFESVCEWGTDKTKTKRRLTFSEAAITLSFVPKPKPEFSTSTNSAASNHSEHSNGEPPKVLTPPQKIHVENNTEAVTKEIRVPGTIFAEKLSAFPVHVRRAIRTRVQFLERRWVKQKQDLPVESEIHALKKQALALQSSLYLWPKDQKVWFVPPSIIEESGLPAKLALQHGENPGDLLEKKFREVEKLERRFVELRQRITNSLSQIENFQSQLFKAESELYELISKVKAEPNAISETQVAARVSANLPESVTILLQQLDVSWRISENLNDIKVKETKSKLPYREYVASSREFLRVGKSAVDSDLMIKQMPTNHYWVHVTSGEGSHVWLEKPKGKSKPDIAAIREAAILAIHSSKLSETQAGEVYVATRSNIEKKKNLSPGKVLVKRSEILFVRYNRDELLKILSSFE